MNIYVKICERKNANCPSQPTQIAHWKFLEQFRKKRFGIRTHTHTRTVQLPQCRECPPPLIRSRSTKNLHLTQHECSLRPRQRHRQISSFLATLDNSSPRLWDVWKALGASCRTRRVFPRLGCTNRNELMGTFFIMLMELLNLFWSRNTKT